MARSLFSLDPPSWLLKLLLSCDDAVEAGAGTSGAGGAASFPELPGRGVDRAEGTSSASMPSGAETPLVMRRSSPCGCVTVILVGGLVSVASGSRAVAGRFLLLVRAGGVGFAGVWPICLTAFSPSASASNGPLRELRRVAMVVLLVRWASSRATGTKFSLVCRSFELRSGGRTALAMMLNKLDIIRDSLGHFSAIHCRAAIACRAGLGSCKTRTVRGSSTPRARPGCFGRRAAAPVPLPTAALHAIHGRG